MYVSRLIGTVFIAALFEGFRIQNNVNSLSRHPVDFFLTDNLYSVTLINDITDLF